MVKKVTTDESKGTAEDLFHCPVLAAAVSTFRAVPE